MTLFRREAQVRQDRLYGEPQLARPVSWALIGAFFLASFLVAAAYLLLAEAEPARAMADWLFAGDGR